MAKLHKIKRHDLQPYYRFDIPGASDLTGASYTCTMIDKKSGTKVIDRSGSGCVITDAAKTKCEYRWQDGDTDAVGVYQIEFEITPQAGGKFTVPVKPAFVLVTADLDGK